MLCGAIALLGAVLGAETSHAKEIKAHQSRDMSTQDGALHSFDFTSIDDMDPSLAGGHRAIYEREVPFELRVQQVADTPQEVGTLEAVKVKLLLLGDDERPTTVKMELTSENDLFFHYTHTLDEAGFRLIQEQQKLMVDFPEYPTVLIRMLNTCIKEPHSHLAVFVMQRGGRAHLDFIQNMEYKFVELLSCASVASDAVQLSSSSRRTRSPWCAAAQMSDIWVLRGVEVGAMEVSLSVGVFRHPGA